MGTLNDHLTPGEVRSRRVDSNVRDRAAAFIESVRDASFCANTFRRYVWPNARRPKRDGWTPTLRVIAALVREGLVVECPRELKDAPRYWRAAQ